MKINLALIVAVFLGLAAAFLNYLFLVTKSKEAANVQFLGIAPGVTVHKGDFFKKEDFAAVDVPASAAETLKTYIELYSARDTVKNSRAVRTYTGGSLVPLDDLKTPAADIDLRKGEVMLWVNVDTRSFVPSLITPGEMVSFVVTNTPTAPGPKRPIENDPNSEVVTTPVIGNVERIGPFRVLAIGNRLGTSEVFSSSGRAPQQENVMAVAVNAPDGAYDAMALKLSAAIQQGGMKAANVIWHGKRKE